MPCDVRMAQRLQGCDSSARQFWVGPRTWRVSKCLMVDGIPAYIYINQSNICQNISEGCGRMLDYSTFLNMFRSEKRRFTDWSARSRVRSSSWSLVSKDVARPDLSPRSSYTIKEARKHKDLWNECEMSKIYPSSKQHLFNLHIFALNWNRNITLSALLQRWNLFNQRNNKNIRWVVAERRLNNSWTIIIITFYNIIYHRIIYIYIHTYPERWERVCFYIVHGKKLCGNPKLIQAGHFIICPTERTTRSNFGIVYFALTLDWGVHLHDMFKPKRDAKVSAGYHFFKGVCCRLGYVPG